MAEQAKQPKIFGASDAFYAPDFHCKVDLEARLQAIPAESQVKGIFFNSLTKIAKEAGCEIDSRKKFSSLSNYPTSLLVQMIGTCAPKIFPSLPVRQAIYEIGYRLFPDVRKTTAGTFLFSIAGKNPLLILKLIDQTARLLSTAANARVNVEDDNTVYVRLLNTWCFPDVYYPGVLCGAMDSVGKECKASVRIPESHPMNGVDIRIDLL